MPSTRSALLALPLLCLPLISAKMVPATHYTLTDLYEGTNFFDSWDFITGPDPTQGWVDYVDQPTAQQNGLINAASGPVYIGVDYTSKLYVDGPYAGRQSIRLSSKKAYNASLIIGDFEHMPGGICGTWPAFWSFGPNWPYSGEIDMVEGQNGQVGNLMSLHTGANCTIAGAFETGTLENSDCYQYAPNEYGSGCGVSDTRSISWGKNFNKNGGGVFATEWTDEYIRIFFFPRSKVPTDITLGKPNPAKWGKPAANFQGSCDIPSHFMNHNILFDTTFCGSWAGPAFENYPECKKLAPNCQDWVAGNPHAFKEAYWLVNYVAVYNKQAIAGSSTSSIASSTPASSAAAAGQITGVAAGVQYTEGLVSAKSTLSVSQLPATAT